MEAFIWIAVGVYATLAVIFFSIGRNNGGSLLASSFLGVFWPIAVFEMARM